jgi:hypothetical protein
MTIKVFRDYDHTFKDICHLKSRFKFWRIKGPGPRNKGPGTRDQGKKTKRLRALGLRDLGNKDYGLWIRDYGLRDYGLWI